MSEEEKVVNECETPEETAEAQTENTEEKVCGEAESSTESSEEQKVCEESEKPETQQEDYKDKWLRVTAEYQNFRNRTAKEKADIYVAANEKIITELLEVLDNFERALGAIEDGDKSKEGIELIYKQFVGILEKQHVKEIPAKGEKFDPRVHMAVQMMSVDGMESDMVAEVIKKGYTLGDKVIRPSMVVVSQ